MYVRSIGTAREAVLIDLTYMDSCSRNHSGCPAQRDDDVLAGALRAESVVPDVCEPLAFLEPTGLHDLAPRAGEHGRGQTDELGEVGAGLDDGAAAVGGVHGVEHDDQALV